MELHRDTIIRIAIMLLASMVIVVGLVGQRIKKETVVRDNIAQEVESIVETGKRKDAFRCSDARAYFAQVGVDVDCERIQREVNGES